MKKEAKLKNLSDTFLCFVEISSAEPMQAVDIQSHKNHP